MSEVLGKRMGGFALLAWLAAGWSLPAHAQTPAVRVAAGGYHNCAVMISGKVKCWGYNAFGQLGLGDTAARGNAPGQMGTALPEIFLNQTGPIAQLSLGWQHTCVLDGVGALRCWGYNAYGQLGYGHANNLGDNPGEVNGGLTSVTTTVQKVAAGAYHTCALKYGGAVWCWGYNGYGQLGAGDTQNRRDGINNSFAIPSLGTGRRAIDIAAGAFSTCALLDNQTVKCWGYNGVGTLGLGDMFGRGSAPGQMGDTLPAVDTGFSPVKELASGAYHVCATGGSGAIGAKCWGYNVFGQLGVGDINNRGDNPGEMGAALPYVPDTHFGFIWKMTAGYGHTCTPAWTGFAGRWGVKCYGYNAFGQLGQGDTADRGDNPGEVSFTLPAPINIGADPDGSGLPWSMIDMGAGIFHTCALMSGGTVKCWGYNGLGQLGLGDTTNRGTDPSQMGNALPAVDL